MSAVGIIVEYNPLHNGHVHHFNKAKEITGAEHAVAVLSGPFLQRGEPGIVSKFARAEMALAMGADLVLELPAAYAVQPAEWFAFGAVSLLHATGVVDSLCFGTESGTLDLLLPLSRILAEESPELQERIAFHLRDGMNYPAAYSRAAAEAANMPGDESDVLQTLQQPNHTLGLHYLIALNRLGSPIRPLTIPRIHAAYHDEQPSHAAIASATAVRKMIVEQDLAAASPYIPESTLRILDREFREGRGPVTWNSFRGSLVHILLTGAPQDLAGLHEVTEGLEHRLRRLLFTLKEPTVGELLQALKTKRYTHTKLQRMLTHIMLGHTKREMSPEALAEGPGYLRVLGFNGRGRQLLKRMKKTASLPVIVKPSSFEHPQLTLDLRASAAYANAFPHPTTQSMFRDYLEAPIRYPE
ncbi:nucleotidyltransferase [Paenibacillus sp. VCA1]|uniref:nucleotidyltransferase n=1 Tax=Paenibacillus sp. VCA1 TaxID=3039148 RepID=UPI00287175A8|nr:nucleotidyltransferase [Paenibacillus sp. VCA1]MDR9854492.1 nucleotidyltransferase [Paenibacillus sp. VCA1]